MNLRNPIAINFHQDCQWWFKTRRHHNFIGRQNAYWQLLCRRSYAAVLRHQRAIKGILDKIEETVKEDVLCQS